MMLQLEIPRKTEDGEKLLRLEFDAEDDPETVWLHVDETKEDKEEKVLVAFFTIDKAEATCMRDFLSFVIQNVKG